MSDAIRTIHDLGQSLWYDNIQRRELENGSLAALIERGDIRGVTSNPSIFHNAIGKSHDYDAALKPMAWAGWKTPQIFERLAVEDIRAAADLFRPLFEQSGGADGYVSLEVSPTLADNTTKTLSEAKRLWALVGRPNLMIKIPATLAGLPAISKAIEAGINVNVTLIFSLERYAAVMEAYLSGLEARSRAGKPLNNIASVASFFVSRVDTKVDARLQELVKGGKKSAEKLLGRAAIDNAKLAYELCHQVFGTSRFEILKAKGARVQRPLWASTSTKNPTYRDVIYIEELIGPDTVNTVPPQTLTAFRDHGIANRTLDEGVAQAHRELKELEALGISMAEVTRQLEEEGVKAFADAFAAMLVTIEERRKAAIKELGPLAKGVQAEIAQLDEKGVSRRIAEHDASLWTTDPAGQAEVRKRLGWLDAPRSSRILVPEVGNLLKDLQQEGYTHALLLGMGGSSLAPEVLRLTLGVQSTNGKPGMDLAILDSTDPVQVQAAARRSPLAKTVFIVSSKSGSTAEMNAFVDFFWDKAEHRFGKKAGRHFIAITDSGSGLEKMARERGFRRVFLADATVGGRSSALIAFGMAPAGLMGQDVSLLLDRAAWMAAQCGADVPAGRNPGLVFGAIMGTAAHQGRDKLTILTDPELSSFGSWAEQLTAESSGKNGRGIVPVDIEPQMPVRNYAADRLFVYLRTNGSQDDFVTKLQRRKLPVLVLDVPDGYALGAEFYRWEMAVAVACSVLGVNAFDQPDVQDAKTRTQQKIAVFQQTRSLGEEKPIWEGKGGEVYGKSFAGLNGAATLAEVVEKFIATAHEGDYVAINAYLPRDERMLKRLQKLRKYILKRTQMTTTLGFGPRFLHSTGQLHKGGADNGLFLEITSEPGLTLDIPNENMTFGVLERAQALGDLEALLGRGRRAIRIHLKDAKVEDLISR